MSLGFCKLKNKWGLKIIELKKPSDQFLVQLSRADDGGRRFKAPNGLHFKPYQHAGIEYGLYFDNVLLADEPGLGKTAQTLGIINERGLKRTFIVCPAALRTTTWVPEIRKWSRIKDPKIKVLTDAKQIQKCEDINFYVCSYHFVAKRENIGTKARPKWHFPNLALIKRLLRFDALVLDESHNLKSTKAARTKAILARDGLRAMAKYTYLLTGTPIVNRPIELYTTAKTFFPQAIGDRDYLGYGMRYCNGFKMRVNRHREVWNFDGSSNLKELGTNLRRSGMLRRKKADVLKDLPAKIRNVVFVSNTRVKFKAFDTDLVVENVPSIDFETASKERLALGLAKVKFALEYIKTQLDGGHNKIIVFAHHTEVLDELKEGLAKFNPLMFRGDTSDADRVKAVESFQSNPQNQIFLGQIQSAGVGLTLTAASYVIFVEPSWVPGENLQAEDRPHRVGQTQSVMVDYLVHENSMDARIVESNVEKQINLDELLE